jgi:hypothetical protein
MPSLALISPNYPVESQRASVRAAALLIAASTKYDTGDASRWRLAAARNLARESASGPTSTARQEETSISPRKLVTHRSGGGGFRLEKRTRCGVGRPCSLRRPCIAPARWPRGISIGLTDARRIVVIERKKFDATHHRPQRSVAAKVSGSAGT